MAKKFSELEAKMSPESRAWAQAMADKMRAEIKLTELTLAELRKDFDFSQEDLAEALDVSQANISMIERRMDIQISTLISYVQAVGGEVEILAHFPVKDGKRTVRLKPHHG